MSKAKIDKKLKIVLGDEILEIPIDINRTWWERFKLKRLRKRQMKQLHKMLSGK